jgi:hypothetical protein
MTYFTRITKTGQRDHQGKFAEPHKAAPPHHLRDKNKSTTPQGAASTKPAADIYDSPGTDYATVQDT